MSGESWDKKEGGKDQVLPLYWVIIYEVAKHTQGYPDLLNLPKPTQQGKPANSLMKECILDHIFKNSKRSAHRPLM
jgi:hypothetical protein